MEGKSLKIPEFPIHYYRQIFAKIGPNGKIAPPPPPPPPPPGGVPLKPPNPYLSLRVILAEKGTHYDVT